MKSIPSLFVLAGSLAVLTACGCDGGDNNPPIKITPTSVVAITSDNETPVARATVAGGIAVASTQTSGSGPGAAAASAKLRSLGAIVRRAMSATARRGVVASAGTHPAGTSSGTEQCGVSGSFTTAFNDKDGNGLVSSGDVITLTFSQCRDDAASLEDGTLVITVGSVTSDAQFSASAQVQGFTIQVVDVTSTLNGQLSVTENDAGSDDDTTLVVGNDGLTLSASSTAYSDTITFNPGMRIETLEDSVSTTIHIDGGFSATSIDGTVTVATVQPIVQLDTDTYPHAGQVRVTGANNSVLVLTAVDATQVQLQLDANGDGTFESTTDAAWSSLIP